MFKKATKQQSRLRMALCGSSGSGKTYTGIAVACSLGDKVAVIDTERGSASKYADKFAFDVCELDSYTAESYLKAIKDAASAGYDVLVIDSLSHAWAGKDGLLERKGAIEDRNGNGWAAWRKITPLHNDLVDSILRYPGHVIVTMRSKTEWVLEVGANGKQAPRKVGLAPVQRDGMEYEFDVVGDISSDHVMEITKSRCEAIDGRFFTKPNGDFAAELRAWLGSGEPMQERVSEKSKSDLYAEIGSLRERLGLTKEEAASRVLAVFGKNIRDMNEAEIMELVSNLENSIEKECI